jgi:hypothetical protein
MSYIRAPREHLGRSSLSLQRFSLALKVSMSVNPVRCVRRLMRAQRSH